MNRRQLFLTVFVSLLSILAAHSKIPCGLPPFVDKLPEKQETELRNIWKNYSSGANCTVEQTATFNVVGTLTPEERASVFGPPAIPVEDSFDGVPLFIKSLNVTLKAEFDKIWTDATLTDGDKVKKLDELAASKFNEQQKENYKLWIEEVKKARKVVDERIAKLSKEAKDIFKRLLDVRAQEQKILAELTPALERELHGLI